jgi:hypothetical protein
MQTNLLKQIVILEGKETTMISKLAVNLGTGRERGFSPGWRGV